jgi:hypothetical protein
MISEWLKLFFFVMGLVCIALAVVLDPWYIVAVVLNWSMVNLIHWFMTGYPMGAYSDQLDHCAMMDGRD